jgi:hypothetical protein
MHEDGSLPQARRDSLLEETVGGELLLYDQNSHIAHCLSPIAACVWRHCDGERDVTELAELAGTSKDLVTDALSELREKDLLDVEPALIMQSSVPGVSRREAIGRVARYGAAAAGASLIVSATAATPAMAASKCVGCKSGGTSDCCICEDKSCAKVGSEKECEKYCKEEKTPASKQACYEPDAECGN